MNLARAFGDGRVGLGGPAVALGALDIGVGRPVQVRRGAAGADVDQHVRAGFRAAGGRRRALVDARVPGSTAADAAALCIASLAGDLVDGLLGKRCGALGDVGKACRLGPGGGVGFLLERMEVGVAPGGIGDRCGCLEVTLDVRRFPVGHAGVQPATEMSHIPLVGDRRPAPGKEPYMRRASGLSQWTKPSFRSLEQSCVVSPSSL